MKGSISEAEVIVTNSRSLQSSYSMIPEVLQRKSIYILRGGAGQVSLSTSSLTGDENFLLKPGALKMVIQLLLWRVLKI